MYENFEKIINQLGYKPADVARGTGLSSTFFTEWKKGKSKNPNPVSLQKIAEFLCVSLDFLMGKTDTIYCKNCEMYYNPLDEESRENHEKIHAAYRMALLKYGFCYTMEECRERDMEAVNILTGSSAEPLTANDLEYYYTVHLKSNFSHLLRQNIFKLEYESFEEYARERIIKDMHQNFMSKDLFDLLVKKYDVDLSYVDENAETLAAASNNAQLMRILNYAKHINPQMLDTIEIQLKALAEQNNKE